MEREQQREWQKIRLKEKRRMKRNIFWEKILVFDGLSNNNKRIYMNCIEMFPLSRRLCKHSSSSSFSPSSSSYCFFWNNLYKTKNSFFVLFFILFDFSLFSKYFFFWKRWPTAFLRRKFNGSEINCRRRILPFCFCFIEYETQFCFDVILSSLKI